MILLVIINGIAWKLEIQFCAESKTNQKCQKWIDVKWINGHLDRRKKFQFALNEVFRRVFIATVKMQNMLACLLSLVVFSPNEKRQKESRIKLSTFKGVKGDVRRP